MKVLAMTSSLLTGVGILVASGAAHSMKGSSYSYEVWDYPGENWSQFNCINDRRVITGGAFIGSDQSDFVHFTSYNDALAIVQVPGANWTRGACPNNAGLAVGWYRVAGTNENTCFLKDGDDYTDVEIPNAATSFCYSVNERGWFGGLSRHVVTGEPFGFVQNIRSGEHRPIDIPGFDFASGARVNNAGTIALTAFPPGATSITDGAAFLMDMHSGEYWSADHPDADWTVLGGLNDRGQVVGYAGIAGVTTGFVYDSKKGSYTELFVPGSAWTTANDINNQGIVVGELADSFGHRAYSATTN